MTTTHFWKAQGRSLETVKEHQAKSAAMKKAAFAWKAEVCDREDVEVMAAGILQGLRATTPEARRALGALSFMREDRRYPGTWLPNRRTKLGRDLGSRADAIRMVNSHHLADALKVAEMVVRNGRMTMTGAGFEIHGDVYVIETAADKCPPDAEPMKHSEVWALREAS